MIKRLLNVLFLCVLSIFGICCNGEKTPEKVNLDNLYLSIFENIDLTNITEDLTLPVKIGDVVIVWDSSNEEVLSNEGVVNRGESDISIILKATLVYNGETKSYQETVIIKGLGVVILDYTKKLDDVFNGVFKNVDVLNVTEDLLLPTEVDGVNISWESSDESVISNTGKVTRLEENTEVTLQAVLAYQGTVVTKEINLMVLKKNEENQNEELEEALKEFVNYENWNFKVNYKVTIDDEYYETLYEYLGYDCSLEYEYEGEYYKDYLVLNSDNIYQYYYDNGDGTYYIASEEDDDFYEYCLAEYLDLSEVLASDFEYASSYYKALDPQTIGELVFGAYDGDTWKYVYVYVSDNLITKIEAASTYNDGTNISEYQYELEFFGYGEVVLEFPDENQGGNETNNDWNICENFEVGGSYLLGVYQGNNEETLFADGTISNTYYLGATTDASNAAYVTVEECEDGYVLEVNINGVVKYIELWNGSKVNVGLFDSITMAWDYNTTYNTFTAEYEGETYYLGTYGTYNTISASKIKYASTSFVCHLYSSDGNNISSEVMEEQIYNENSSQNRLEDVLTEFDAVGLPSIGEYNVLVIPVEFSDTLVSDEDINRLNLAFNDKEGLTGWESVSSYYYKASFGKLNLTFDIPEIYKSSKSSTYYNNLENGYEVLLLEVLSYLEPLYDLTDYDYNNDGIIDGIYIIYSAPVDYESDESIYWAYVSWYAVENEEDNMMFDGLDAYYYLFAGFDFMDEDAKESVTGFEYNGYIEGLKINASTYIHETGHMLGLDDYYDYDASIGSGDGLGGADMMDYTVGDHNSYSKTILEWITPTVVTETTTITIDSFVTSGDAIMILLDSDGSYFSEYILIDLYVNEGLNSLHSEQQDSLLFDGAEYGVRIYHISSSVNDPFSDQNYSSITDNNNTSTKNALIKLIEADGGKKFGDSNGYAVESDLWQTGDVFSDYNRYDGKLINFIISFNNVNNNTATITITFI